MGVWFNILIHMYMYNNVCIYIYMICACVWFFAQQGFPIAFSQVLFMLSCDVWFVWFHLLHSSLHPGSSAPASVCIAQPHRYPRGLKGLKGMWMLQKNATMMQNATLRCENFQGLRALGTIPNLRELSLDGNPVVEAAEPQAAHTVTARCDIPQFAG